MSEREDKFEKMLSFVQQNYYATLRKMDALKKDNKTKTATYRQLMGDKLMYRNILSMYKLYGLIDEI